MITCVNSTKLPVKDQARILASWLKRGLSFPYDKQSADASATVLYREPPARTELAFQQKGGDAAMKTKLTPLLGEQSRKELFCIGHSEFALKSGTDQEHADPFTEMRQKQSSLLKYLGDNQEFTAAFLQEEGMSDFFKMSNESTKEKEERETAQRPAPPTPITIMGTRLFYLLCYNDQNNIWLLCHGCNITKGSKDTLTWFKEHSRFGTLFLDAVNTAGGLHTGLLIDKIYKKSDDDFLLHIDDEYIRIPCETNITKGIGEFVRSWYHQLHQGEYDTNKALYEGIDELTKTELGAIRELRNNCQDKKADEKQKQLLRILRESTRVYETTLDRQRSIASPDSEGHSPGSSTSDDIQAKYESNAVEDAKIRWHNRYCETKIWRWIKKAYPNPVSTIVSASTSATGPTISSASNIFLSELLKEADDVGLLESTQVDTLLEKVKSLLKSESPPPEEFKKIFLELSMGPATKAIQDTELAQQEAKKQTQEKEAERQEKEAEKQLRIQAEQEAEKQKQEVEKQKQENTHLRQLLAQVQSTTIPVPSATTQTTSSTPTSNPSFWQTASTSTKKREFDITDTVQLDAEAQRVAQPSKRATLDSSLPIPSSTDDNDDPTSVVTDPQTNTPR